MTTTQIDRRRPYRPPAPLGGRAPIGGTFRRRAAIVGFLGPAIVILGAFVLWPMLSALQLSFTDASGFGDPEFIGLANYERVFTDPDVLRSIGNTALYAVLFTPVAIAVALALALVLNHPGLPFRGAFRSALFLPFIVSLAVAAFAWSYLLDPQIGLLNHWLQIVGIRLGNVLQDPTLAMPTVVLVAVWKSFGFYMVIFLAGLQEIPASLYEAAQLDGAGARQRFANITFPMLSNTLAFVVIVALIAALQAFDQIYVLTGGGPFRSTETIVMQVYESGFRDLDIGFASALAYVLLLATLLLSLVQFLFFGKRGEDTAS
ncbi:carbohydrate ABC transporter permease [Frigoribacterium salinisoli]